MIWVQLISVNVTFLTGDTSPLKMMKASALFALISASEQLKLLSPVELAIVSIVVAVDVKLFPLFDTEVSLILNMPSSGSGLAVSIFNGELYDTPPPPGIDHCKKPPLVVVVHSNTACSLGHTVTLLVETRDTAQSK
jgi:hypothetical protein